jgi:hypothetical protein
MKSPFKFLNAYEYDDREVFFGREKEIDALYRMVYQTDLILVYGYSGTGKTSLVQCGLASRFDGPQWYPFFIRKGENINTSLRTALFKGLNEEPQEDVPLPELIEEIVDEYLSPVYLFFDQFEELFILGSPAEQDAFIASIQDLLRRDLACKVVFIIREEYLGELYLLEQALPGLFDFKLRVEPMNNRKVKEVLQSSFSAFNISLEVPEEDRLDEIIQNISGEKSLIQLPYLQVYLDMMWREDYQRAYPEVKVPWAWPDPPPPLQFTRKEIKDFGSIEGVLQRFLLQQEQQISEQLQRDYSRAGISPKTIRAVLDVFVTEEGTKRPIPFKLVEDEYELPERILEKFHLQNPALSQCFHYLENSRILRIREESFEIAHDSLASLIDEERTEDQKRYNRIQQEIRVFYQTGEFLSADYLTRYQNDFAKLDLDPALAKFITESREVVAEQERMEQAAKERELTLTREKLDAERRASRRQRIFLAVATLALIVVSILGIYSITQNRQIQLQNYNSLKEAGESLRNSGQYQAALSQLREAEPLASKSAKR